MEHSQQPYILSNFRLYINNRASPISNESEVPSEYICSGHEAVITVPVARGSDITLPANEKITNYRRTSVWTLPPVSFWRPQWECSLFEELTL